MQTVGEPTFVERAERLVHACTCVKRYLKHAVGSTLDGLSRGFCCKDWFLIYTRSRSATHISSEVPHEAQLRSDPFKWRHFEGQIILLCVRWYCRYSLSYRDLEEIMQERGLEVDHSTIFRWVQRYAPEINRRIRPHLKMSGTSFRIDETYVKVGKSWKYLYRALDKEG